MKHRGPELFTVGYDWRSGDWTVRVEGFGVLVASKPGYPSERAATQGMRVLRRMLTDRKDGDVSTVVTDWLAMPAGKES